MNSFLAHGWDVLVLFLIPIGGGIPGGVLLAKKFEIEWPFMMLLYFISDVILACVFEPLLYYFRKISKIYKFLSHVSLVSKMTIQKTISYYGNNTGILALIMIAFGSDPMTGRAVTLAVGHGFFSGWLIAIIGDMFYFSLIMVSTLWLSHILGDGTWTMVIILVLMMGLPPMIRWMKNHRREKMK